MEIKPSTQRMLGLMAAGLMVAAAFVIFAALIVPEYGVIQELRGELIGKSKLYQEQKDVLEQVQDLIAQYQGVARLEETLMMVLPTKEKSADIVHQLDAIARVGGTYLQSVSLDYPPVQKAPATAIVKNFGSLRFTIKLTGSYAAFKNVLEALETNVRIMDVNTLKMEPAGDPEKNPDLFNLSLTVDTYYQPN